MHGATLPTPAEKRGKPHGLRLGLPAVLGPTPSFTSFSGNSQLTASCCFLFFCFFFPRCLFVESISLKHKACRGVNPNALAISSISLPFTKQ